MKYKGKDICNFCTGELKKEDLYYICPKCKAIICAGEMNSETILKDAHNNIDKIQELLQEKKTELHSIEQRHINGGELSKNEEVIRASCLEFQDCSHWIKTLEKDGIGMENKRFCQELYRLNKVKQNFEEFLATEKL